MDELSMSTDTVSLIDVAGYLPENIVAADYFAQYADPDEVTSNLMFKAPKFRRHIAPGEKPADMAERAVAPILERQGRNVLRDIDVLIVHTQLPEIAIVGNGGEVAARLGISPEWLIDLHNGGCASFVYGMKLARQILLSTDARSALVVTVQNAAGQIFTQEQVRGKAQAAIPGDGAGAGLLVKSGASPILDIETRHLPEFAGQMTVIADPPRRYWEAGAGEMHVGFTESKIAKVLQRGNRLVPEVAEAVCKRIGVTSPELDLLVTNQPNRAFLRNWRDALQLPPERHPDTFDDCGNLFGAGIPVTFDRAVDEGRVPAGALVMFAGFAHAGDFAGAAAVRWGGR
ncbi:3-oxoacyl-[acyl-carrier-protein] synthase III C-terminal domain-containing protein [Nocardia sp. CDC153]|uniref:3-oxoacyl-ACP synthase III family protein n=1 Tax=Nocardia sp. CDC153 TaxID=3112167 RepID=UPI002DB6B118|nr:3-oxoacyl-[acyl-carrier-protein] synthase III C-terminal domain-containing protein [Nocardia sp. CDC153]MEC3956775.1 3-oxoacyl-[acyl-carrier-protein] synthase III C-terminal domain-containing protein [Nocardia sp. CDC153]